MAQVRCPATGCSKGAHGAPAKPGKIAYKEFGGRGRRGFQVVYKRCPNNCKRGYLNIRGVS